MRLTWRRITIALAGLAALGAAFWSLAPYNVAATVGHLPPVRAILREFPVALLERSDAP